MWSQNSLTHLASQFIFRCRDNIANLRFRVKVAPVSSKLPSVLSLSSSTETESSPEKEAVSGALGVREELSLAWQQKVFSREEFRSFANAKEEDFESPMNKKLVCDAKKLMSDGFVPKNRYYTCFIPLLLISCRFPHLYTPLMTILVEILMMIPSLMSCNNCLTVS